jgi:hypothetical protein
VAAPQASQSSLTCACVAEPTDHPPSVLNTADERTRRLYAVACATAANAALRSVIEAPAARLTAPPDDLRLVLVPGLFHREYPHTGADGAFLRTVAESVGLGLETIPIDGMSGLDASADAINDYLRSGGRQERVLLFSLSKGSNEVRHALTRAAGRTAFQRVRAWTSISGLPFGSPAVDLTHANPLRRLVLKPWCRFKGWNYEHLRDALRHRPGAPFVLPPHMRFVQIAAFPLREHLKDGRSRRLHKGLSPLGPNDGFALLEELAALPGELYPVWGVDHYLTGTTDLAARLEALLRHLWETS